MPNPRILVVLNASQQAGTAWPLNTVDSVASLASALQSAPAARGVWIVGATAPRVIERPQFQLLVAGGVRERTDASWWASDDARFERLGARLADDPVAQLSTLCGPFLIAYLNRQTGRSLFAIDRFGIHSLCFARAGEGTLLVATDATLLRQHPAFRAQIDPQAIYNFLFFHMVPSPGTVFRGVRKLEPAQCLTADPQGPHQVHTYWRADFAQRLSRSSQELEKELVPALQRAVARCPIGESTSSFLSGGIDSSTVTGLLVRQRGEPTPAYSMGFAADGYDEARYAQIAASHFKARLRQFYVQPDQITEQIFAVADTYDEPFGNSSAVPTLLCARYARSEGTQVMLAGDGGDELYGGNERYAKQQVFEWYHGIPGALRHGLIEPLLVPSNALNELWPIRKLASYVRQAKQPMPGRLHSYNFLNREEGADMFAPEFIGRVDRGAPEALLGASYADLKSQDLLDRMLHLDWKFTLADNDLRKVGRMCELAGVEVWFPWLDEDVVDLSLQIPGNVKMKGLELRSFAKRALTGFLPQEILHKPKHGFGLPFGEWLKTSPALQEVVYDLLRRFAPRGVLRPQFVDELIVQHRDGHAAYFGSMVWVIAMLEAWLEKHRFELRI